MRRLFRDLGPLFHALGEDGRDVVGPTVADGAIIYDVLVDPSELPKGWTHEQAPGHYRLKRREDERVFGYTVGPTSFKRFLFPPRQLLFRARREGKGFQMELPPEPKKLAILGARACELAAIAIQDTVLLHSGVEDPAYAARRSGLFVVAVQCANADPTCFCDSMNCGPRVDKGFDLCLTETDHGFVVEVGSDAGQALLDGIPTEPAGALNDAPEAAAANCRFERALPDATSPEGLREKLLAALEGPHWDKVAERCLGCANCTMVCPTCFCTTVEDVTTLTGEAERVRRWDSCFNLDHSYIHGGVVRAELGQRYRQWLTHKLATWWDQFDTSGCTGCGRCVTWCPAGIDIVEEAISCSP